MKGEVKLSKEQYAMLILVSASNSVRRFFTPVVTFGAEPLFLL